jgi:uncharacterized membrane protein
MSPPRIDLAPRGRRSTEIVVPTRRVSPRLAAVPARAAVVLVLPWAASMATTVHVDAQSTVTIDAVEAVEAESTITLNDVADGGVLAVGHEEFGPTGLWTSIEWSSEGGSAYIEGNGPMQGLPSTAMATTPDGLVVVGGAYFEKVAADAYRWSPWSGYENLGHPAEFISSWATGLSDDGSIVVGTCYSFVLGDRAFRWTDADGMELLDGLATDAPSVADAVSGDGTVVVGESLNRACRWIDGVPHSLGVLPGETDSRALAVDADGSVVVGASGARAFRWSSDFGMMDLGVLPGATHAIALGVSGDGTTVVGESGFEAFIWTESLGMVALSQYLMDAFELELTGHQLRTAMSISADGSAIVGQGNGIGWVVRGLPIPENEACQADLDQDGTVDAADLTVLLSQWGDPCCGGDLDEDGKVDSADLTILLASWGADCVDR